MSYQLYRNTTIGNTLQESLDELIQYGQITPNLAIKVLLQFDKSINQALSNRVKSRLTFKAGKLNTYRYIYKLHCFDSYSASRFKMFNTIAAFNVEQCQFLQLFCDNVWTFMLNDVEFREVQEIAKVDKVKIVACDGKNVDDRR